MNWEDGPTFEEYDAEYGENGRLHRLNKRRQRDLEKADWEEEENEYTL